VCEEGGGVGRFTRLTSERLREVLGGGAFWGLPKFHAWGEDKG